MGVNFHFRAGSAKSEHFPELPPSVTTTYTHLLP